MAENSKISNGRADGPLVGLALSGGAARGMAHIGALQALEENNIRIDRLSGTSIGSLVAAFYAFGISLDQMRRQAEEMSWMKVSSFTIPRSGFLSNKMLGEIVEKFLGDVNIEDSPIPLAIIATDIHTGKRVVLREGNLAQAIMASSCVPGIFTPVRIGEATLVDGFLVENVPVTALREIGAEVLLGIDLSHTRHYRLPNSIMNIMMNAFEIAIDANTKKAIFEADVIIAPDMTRFSSLDSENHDELFQQGYAAAISQIPDIRKAIQSRQKGPLSLWQRFIQPIFGGSESLPVRQKRAVE